MGGVIILKAGKIGAHGLIGASSVVVIGIDYSKWSLHHILGA